MQAFGALGASHNLFLSVVSISITIGDDRRL
jgi:hypothetical protein